MFCTSGECISKTGLSNVCTHDQNGRMAKEINFPFRIEIEPTGNVEFMEKANTDAEFNEQFLAIGPKTNLYKVKTFESPEDKDGMILGKFLNNNAKMILRNQFCLF